MKATENKSTSSVPPCLLEISQVPWLPSMMENPYHVNNTANFCYQLKMQPGPFGKQFQRPLCADPRETHPWTVVWGQGAPSTSFSIQALSVEPGCYPFLKFLPLNKSVHCFLIQPHLSSQGTRRTQWHDLPNTREEPLARFFSACSQAGPLLSSFLLAFCPSRLPLGCSFNTAYGTLGFLWPRFQTLPHSSHTLAPKTYKWHGGQACYSNSTSVLVVCVSHFCYCCEKNTWQSNLKNQGLILTYGLWECMM